MNEKVLLVTSLTFCPVGSVVVVVAVASASVKVLSPPGEFLLRQEGLGQTNFRAFHVGAVEGLFSCSETKDIATKASTNHGNRHN